MGMSIVMCLFNEKIAGMTVTRASYANGVIEIVGTNLRKDMSVRMSSSRIVGAVDSLVGAKIYGLESARPHNNLGGIPTGRHDSLMGAEEHYKLKTSKGDIELYDSGVCMVGGA